MYENHWGLQRRPFENWSDDTLYYPSETHQAALLKLRYAIECRRAAILVAGDSGVGKTMLVDMLLRQLPEPFSPAVRIVFPMLAPDQLVGHLADKITGLPGDAAEPPRLTLARLTSFFDRNVEREQHAVVVVDEAHLLAAGDGLETLRLLLNLSDAAAGTESAWSLVLVGHATLMGLVEQNRSLDERMAAKCLIPRFHVDQTAAYLQHRIAAAGGALEAIFAPDAVEAIHRRSSGVPRRVNRIADLALMVGFADELEQIRAEQIEGVHQELIGAG